MKRLSSIVVFIQLFGQTTEKHDVAPLLPELQKHILMCSAENTQVTANPVRCWILIWCIDKLHLELQEVQKRQIYSLTQKVIPSLKNRKDIINRAL